MSKTSGSTAIIVLVCALFALTTIVRVDIESSQSQAMILYGRTLVVFCAFNALIFLSLVYRQNQTRYRKVLSTFVGTRTLIDLCVIIVVVVFSTNEEVQQLLINIIALWRMCIVGGILKDALDVPLPAGILLSIAFTLISITIANLAIGLLIAPDVVPDSE